MQGAGDERDGFPLHPTIWSPKQLPITSRKLIPKTLKSVGVSEIEAELHSKRIYERV